MLKIAGGKYRSRLLEVPLECTVPTKSMVREALSNALKENISGANVLDLFAGSGALGIEMLSRGAMKCTFVDASNEAIKAIKHNLSILKEINGNVCNMDFRSFLMNANEVFDIVLLDPPYKEIGWYQEAINILLDKKLIKDGSVIVLEYEDSLIIDEKSFARVRDYRYGRSKIKILWR